MKTCFKCHIKKPYSEYYKHSEMADGYLGKCKDCTKKDNNKHRKNNIEKVREYDRKRANLSHRVEKRKEISERWKKDKQLKELKKLMSKKWDIENKQKKICHSIVSRAVRSGKIIKENCCVCGNSNSQAHHENYNKPLDVIWYCAKHHGERHRVINEERRN